MSANIAYTNNVCSYWPYQIYSVWMLDEPMFTHAFLFGQWTIDNVGIYTCTDVDI